MSWLVKLGKAEKQKVSSSSGHRQYKSPKPSLSSLITKLNQNENRPLNLNCNNFRLQTEQVQPPHQYSQFAQVIKAEKQKKKHSSKTRKNIIFTQNNCFARAVAQYKEQQKLKSTVKFGPSTIIHQAEVQESIDIQETIKLRKGMQQQKQNIDKVDINRLQEITNELQQTKNKYQQIQKQEQESQISSKKQQYEIIVTPPPIQTNTVNIDNLPQQPQSPRSLTPTRQGKTTILKCRVVQTPTKISYLKENTLTSPQSPIVHQPHQVLQHFPIESQNLRANDNKQIIEYCQTVVRTTIIPMEYKLVINGAEIRN